MDQVNLVDKIVDFVEQCSEPKEILIPKNQAPYFIAIIKHLGSGKILLKLTKTIAELRFLRYYLKNKKIAEGELTEAYKSDTRLAALHLQVDSFEESWDVCSEVCGRYAKSGLLFKETNQNFFHRHLSKDFIELIDGALAGDGGMYNRGPSSIFQLALEIKQLGHLEEYVEELEKFGFEPKIFLRTSTSKITGVVTNYCATWWSLWAFNEHRLRWYDEFGKKRLPEDVSNAPTFWRWFYAGDGCLYITSNHSYRILIAANDFKTAEVDRLIHMLFEHGIKATRYLKRITESNGLPQWTIVINKRADVDRFLTFIGGPVKSLEYKWKRPMITKNCFSCGVEFLQNRNNSKYCSFKCQRKSIDARSYWRKKNKQP